jgi:hypothetical protein
MGMFDDLIPQKSAAPSGGMFDDLIPGGPSQAQAAQEARDAAAARVKPTNRSHFDVGNTTWSDVNKAGAYGGRGFNKAIAPVVDAAMFLPNLLTVGANKAAGTELRTPSQVFHDTFVNAPPAETPGQKTMEAAGEMAGANMPMLAGGLGLATSGVRAGVPLVEQAAPMLSEGVKKAPGILAGKVRGAADAVLEWMAEHPTAAARSDTAGALASGAGGETGRSIAENQGGGENAQRGAQLAGQLLSPAAMFAWSKYGPTPLAIKAGTSIGKKALGMVPESALPDVLKPEGGTVAERLAERLKYSNREGKYANPDEPPPPEPNFATRQMDKGAMERGARAAGAVQTDLKDIVTRPDVATNMAEANKVKAAIPGFNPGLAKETGDPALLNLQRNMESNATGAELRTAQDRANANAGAVRAFADKAAPPPGGAIPPEDVATAAGQRRVDRLTGRLEQQQGAVRGQIAERSNIPPADRTASGERLRDIRNTAEQQSENEVNRLRGNIAAPDTVVEVHPATEDQPAVTMTVNQILNRRAALNQEARDYSHATNRSVDDIRRMRQINDERQHLDSLIENINLPGMTEYRDYYRNEHVPRFREGAAKDVGRYDQNAIGKNYVASEDVPREFFQPNNISEARQFNRTFGNDPQARQAMTDYALDSLRTDPSVMDPVTHTLKEGGIQRWMTKYSRILDEMPWIREAVSVRDPDALYGRLGQLEQRQRQASTSTLAKTLDKEPGAAVDSALSDWRVARTMKNSVRNDPRADAALTRAVWERLPDPMDAAAVQKFVTDNKRSLDILLTPKHLADIDTIVKAATIEGRAPFPKGAAEQPKSIADKVGTFAGISIPSFLSRIRSMAQGRTGGPYTLTDIGLQAFSKFSTREVEAAWKEALFNPNVARDVASIVSGKGTKPIISRLHNYLLTVGARDTTQEKPGQ